MDDLKAVVKNVWLEMEKERRVRINPAKFQGCEQSLNASFIRGERAMEIDILYFS